MSSPPAAWRASVLVVAHPDDEMLWFSSLLGRITRTIICFEDCDDFPELGPARRSAMQAHPLPHLSWLRLPEPCSVAAVDWDHPLESAHGLALNAPDAGVERPQRYERSFRDLKARLERELEGVERVFTHNPWGEYGHADHAQVCRAIQACREELGFKLWYSGYVSPRSMPLAARHLPRLMNHFTLPTDLEWSARLRAHYDQHGAWTWHADYLPPDFESFLEDSDALPRQGALAPLVCVRT
jgi:LmbE family N-acetylglucosaminyl deacetylase